MKYTFWTDGSANPNPGPGGFAVIEVRGEEAKPVILGSEKKSSNIRMEGMAILAAIRRAGGNPCKIYTDSEFWFNVATKWMETWAKNEWRRGVKFDEKGKKVNNGKEIANVELVQELYEVYDPETVELRWTRGHVGTKYNEMADEWANRARAGEKL